MKRILSLLFLLGTWCSFNLAAQNLIVGGDMEKAADEASWIQVGKSTFSGNDNTQLVWGDVPGSARPVLPDNNQAKYIPNGFGTGNVLTVCEGWSGYTQYFIAQAVTLTANTTYTATFDYNIGEFTAAWMEVFIGKTDPTTVSDYTEGKLEGLIPWINAPWQQPLGDKQFSGTYTPTESGTYYFVIKWGCTDGVGVGGGYFNTSIDNVSLVATATNVQQYPVTLKIVDQSKGEITNNVNDNNETNIFCWIDDNLKSQNPRTPDNWWYPMYNDPTVTPTGQLIKGTDDWTWEITLNATPGTYKWNPNAKTLGFAPINPDMFVYTGDDGNNLIFTVADDGTISGNTQLVIPAPQTPIVPPTQYPVTLKIVDQSKGEITNDVNNNDGTNIFCWIDGKLTSQNPRTPSDWWYPMYAELGTTPTGELIKGTNDWTWEITLNASAGTYSWNPYAKSLNWSPINPNMFAYTGDNGSNLIFTVSDDGTISGNTQLVIPAPEIPIVPPTQYPVTLKLIDQSKGEITNNVNDNNETNIICWIDDNLKSQNPNTPDNWWYPMYDDASMTLSGQLIKGTDDWTWQITFDASPGTYAWNPNAKTLGFAPINPDMFAYTGDDGNNLIFTVSDDGTISGNTQLVIPKPETPIVPPTQYPVTLKLIDQSKGKVTNNVNDNNETNIFCWIDDSLKSQNLRTPDDWWYPMYNDPTVTPTGQLIKGNNDWTWETTLSASAGTYKWNPYAKTLGWAPINPNMFAFTGDDKDNNLIFTISDDGTISGNTELVIPPSNGIPEILSGNVIVVGEKSSLSATFEGTADITIYSAQGQLIKKATAQNTFKADNLSAGIYLVKIGNKTYKAIVK